MSWNNTIEIIYDLLILGFAFFSYYMSKRNDLIQVAENAILLAEEKYKDATNSGGEKFEYAVTLIYSAIPASIKFLFPRETVAKMLQTTFDRIEEYALMQLNKASDKVNDFIEEKIND